MESKYFTLSESEKREIVRAKRKAFYQANKERIKAETRANSLKDPAKTSAYMKAYRQKNKTKLDAYFRAHYLKNKDRIAKRHRKRDKERCKTDPNYGTMRKLRCRIYNAVRKQYGKKAKRSMDLIGCTVEFLRQHIESQWLPGMTWDNWTWDGWHIDHKRPCASFDLTDPEQQKACFHWSNLAPLWWLDNIRKSDSKNAR